MGIKVGIVGLPNVGKSTLFNAITNSKVEAANYPFATIEPNISTVKVNDKRFEKIVEIIKPKKAIKSTIEFFDIAGLVKNASKGEGLGNKFLANIREVDAIIHMVRCFEDTNITHVNNIIDPINDIKIVELELLLADIETIIKIIQRTSKKAKNDPKSIVAKEYDLAVKIKSSFEKEIKATDIELNHDELKILKPWNLLTLKPILYVANLDEKEIKNPLLSLQFKNLQKFLNNTSKNLVAISAQIESDISILEKEDKKLFLEDLGIENSGIDNIILNAYKLLDVETYFTAGKEEVKAWIFKKGWSAPKCAGIIHSDFERGFIRAEIIKYDDFIKYGNELECKKQGKVQIEGKEYIMQDGDIVHFRFNV